MSKMAIGALVAALVGAASTSTAQEAAHFHHVHLNVVDPEATLEFYRKVFGALPIEYADRTEALFTERSFIFLDRVGSPPPSELTSAIWHIGWGGVDGPNEYEWWKREGVRFHTPATPLGSNHYMYMLGPDDELIEIFTGERNHRFNHVHLFATDVNITTQWYARHLGLEPRRQGKVEPTERGGRLRWSNGIRVDNVSIVIFGLPNPDDPPTWWPPEARVGAFSPTRGRAIDHIAFSYRDIEPVFERMKTSGAEIVEPIAPRERYRTRSFFALAPDGVLVEIIEADPLPEAAWD